jgi:hypothetical protein
MALATGAGGHRRPLIGWPGGMRTGPVVQPVVQEATGWHTSSWHSRLVLSAGRSRGVCGPNGLGRAGDGLRAAAARTGNDHLRGCLACPSPSVAGPAFGGGAADADGLGPGCRLAAVAGRGGPCPGRRLGGGGGLRGRLCRVGDGGCAAPPPAGGGCHRPTGTGRGAGGAGAAGRGRDQRHAGQRAGAGGVGQNSASDRRDSPPAQDGGCVRPAMAAALQAGRGGYAARQPACLALTPSARSGSPPPRLPSSQDACSSRGTH